jgi:arylsulfatase A-like enzyme
VILSIVAHKQTLCDFQESIFFMGILSFDQTTVTHPNILLIVMDAVRAQNLSCYGYHRLTTPNLEQFAEHCVVYENAISAGCWSLPGHASIFTGLYPSTHRAHDQHKFLETQYPTMAELLRLKGYRTIALCHKWDVGPFTGLDRGFEWFNHSNSRVPRTLRRIAFRADNGVARVMGRRDSGARYTNRRIRSLLPQLQADEQPFFMFVSYLEAHSPYRPPREYNLYLPNGVSPRRAREVNQDRWKYMVGQAPMDDRDFEILTALYDGELSYVDARVAQVLDWLEQLDMLDQMMVIITADHGENLGEHQLMTHGFCLYDTVVRVPLLIHYPRGTARPGQVTHQVQTVDLLPTVLAMLGDTLSETYRSLQGYDLLSSSRHEFAIAEQAHPDFTSFYKRMPGTDISKYDQALKMIRTDRHKYIWSSDDSFELHDLQADPAEVNNIIFEQPAIAQDLAERLAKWSNRVQPVSPLDRVSEFDE